VGGDGKTNTATAAADSGIVVAAGGLADYDVTATATVLTVRADAAHTSCSFTYTEPVTAGDAPIVNTAGLTVANCQ
jgi:hypothetical protein